MKPFLILAITLTGCATLRDRACKQVCVEDTCVNYCETQERVTRRCAKNAFKSDTGHEWGPDGSYIDEHGRRRFIAACTEYYPDHEYKFHIWVWKAEAWREGHERCHRQVYLEGGSLQDHWRRCGDFGANRGRRRM